MKLVEILSSFRVKTDKDAVLTARLIGIMFLLMETFMLVSPLFFDVSTEVLEYVSGFREHAFEAVLLATWLIVGLEEKKDESERADESTL